MPLAVLPVAVVLTACGGSHRSTSVAHTKLGLQTCGVHVYLAGKATHAEERAVGAHAPGIDTVKLTPCSLTR